MKITQSYVTLCNPIDYTVCRILQARILEWVAISFSRGFSQPREKTQVSWIADRFFTSWATWEAQALYQGRGRGDPNSFYDAAVTLIPKDSKAKEGRDREKEEERKRERERDEQKKITLIIGEKNHWQNIIKKISSTLKRITYPECVCQEMQSRSSVWKYIINIINHIKRKKN